MDETVSPDRLGAPIRYDRLTTLEVEDPSHATTTAGESDMASEFRQFCLDFQLQLESACQSIAWDRIFMSAFLTISVWLIVFAFFPYLRTEMVADQQFQHQFLLNSLTITEFQATRSQVTGKCDITLNITNNGERSIYHETSVLSIFMDHELLWVARTSDFFLDVGNSIMFNVNINKTTISVPAAFVPTAMLESQKLHKPLRFKLKYDGMLREGLAAWYEERSHVYIICGWIEMRFVNDTALAGGPTSCTLENY